MQPHARGRTRRISAARWPRSVDAAQQHCPPVTLPTLSSTRRPPRHSSAALMQPSVLALRCVARRAGDGRGRVLQVWSDNSIELIILFMLCSARCGHLRIPFSRQIFFKTVVHTPNRPGVRAGRWEHVSAVIDVATNPVASSTRRGRARGGCLTRDIDNRLVEVHRYLGKRDLPVGHGATPGVRTGQCGARGLVWCPGSRLGSSG